MILKELARKKFDSIVAMRGDKVQLVFTEPDGTIKEVLSVDVDKTRTFDEAVMYEMQRGAGNRTGIGGFFLDKETD